jgi:hypothetical protein
MVIESFNDFVFGHEPFSHPDIERLSSFTILRKRIPEPWNPVNFIASDMHMNGLGILASEQDVFSEVGVVRNVGGFETRVSHRYVENIIDLGIKGLRAMQESSGFRENHKLWFFLESDFVCIILGFFSISRRVKRALLIDGS